MRDQQRIGARKMRSECARVLRLNANAEKDPGKREILIEMHNTLLQLDIEQVLQR